MNLESAKHSEAEGRAAAQTAADRIRILREELSGSEVESVLALTPDQRLRFDEWSRARLAALADQFDVDTSVSQKRISWGMRIASTLGGFAVCTAVVLFFMRYWGYLDTWLQLVIVILTPVLSLCGAEFMARRERTQYFTGLLALVTLVSFILNLVVVGSVFNIVSTEQSLLAWGALALILAYRYGLRLMLAAGLLLVISYLAALVTARMGYQWLAFWDRPEHFLLLGLAAFALPSFWKQAGRGNFAPVYRLVGALTFLIAVLFLAGGGSISYLRWDIKNIERLYEFVGLVSSAGAIWLGIKYAWTGIVDVGAIFFTIFLYQRLYHWLWDWMPKYLFFATIGALGIGLVLVFRYLRGRLSRQGNAKLPRLETELPA